jgi:GNAT superfamily N-acetyltransferase
MEYRSATKDDIDDIMELWIESAQYHEELDGRLALNLDAAESVKNFYTEKFFNEDSFLVVAETEAKLVGVSGAIIQKRPPIQFVREVGFVDIIFVTAEYRNHGIGAKLFEKVMEWMKSKGLKKSRLTVATSNNVGINFWRKTGYNDVMQIMELEL